MKPKVVPLLNQCIEAGIRRGYCRAHKHCEEPGEEAIFENIERCIMGEIYEWFDFDELDS